MGQSQSRLRSQTRTSAIHEYSGNARVSFQRIRSSSPCGRRRVTCIRNAFGGSASVSKMDNSPCSKGSPDALSERPESRGGQKTPNFALLFDTSSRTSLKPRSHPLNPTTERIHGRTRHVPPRLRKLAARHTRKTYIATDRFAQQREARRSPRVRKETRLNHRIFYQFRRRLHCRKVTPVCGRVLLADILSLRKTSSRQPPLAGSVLHCLVTVASG